MAADAMTTDIRIKALELAIDAVSKGAEPGPIKDVACQFEAFLCGGPTPPSEASASNTPLTSESWLTPEMAAAARRMGME